MKRCYSVIGLTALAVASLFSFRAGKVIFIRSAAAAEVEVRPYVRNFVRYYLDANGIEKEVARVVVAQRRDGARLEQESVVFDGHWVDGGQTITFADGIEVRALKAARVRSSQRLRQAAIAAAKERLLHPPPGCVWEGEIIEGDETLFGYRAIRVSRPENTGLQRTLFWRMPLFGCDVMQTVMQERAQVTEPWRTSKGTRLTSITDGEPPAALFDEASEFEEVGPSELMRRVYRVAGMVPERCPRCFEDDPRQEAEYRANKVIRH